MCDAGTTGGVEAHLQVDRTARETEDKKFMYYSSSTSSQSMELLLINLPYEVPLFRLAKQL